MPDRNFLLSYNEGRLLNIFEKLETEGKENMFEKTFANVDPIAVDLLQKMLEYDPEKRITIEDALKHEFIGDLHYAPDEPTTTSVSAFDFDFEVYDLSIEEQKELILDEIALYHSKKAQKKYIKYKKKYPNGMLYKKYGYSDGLKIEPQETKESDSPRKDSKEEK